MISLYRFFLGSFIVGLTGIAQAANPIIKGYADPHIRVWNDKMIMAIGKDLGPEIKRAEMTHWALFSSSDLVSWEKEVNVLPEDTYLGAGYTHCWAPDIMSRDGKYYFYFSNHNKAAGVLVADAPEGPYEDVLKRPLIGDLTANDHRYDPTVFKDDDGEYYLIFGRDGFLGGKIIHYQIARLNEDMISFADEPRDLLTDLRYGFGAENRARDHQYFHKYNGVYYLSCGDKYMTSTNIYGPYSTMRASGQAESHSSFLDYNGQSYHAYENTCDPYGNRIYRQIMMTYLHYRENGDMVDDSFFLKKGIGYALGVGNYDATWPKIEAEWFFKKSGMIKNDGPDGGFEMENIQDGNVLYFPKMHHLPSNATLYFRVAAANPRGGIIEVHEASPEGPLLGLCVVPPTENWDTYKTVACSLQNEAGTIDLCFVFRGTGDDMMHLDSFRID